MSIWYHKRVKKISKIVIFTTALLALRNINLMVLPLYLDEGNYIFWAKLVRDSLGYAYISLQDGKTPLFIWAIAYFKPFLGNYLFTARFISALAGVVSALSWASIFNQLNGKKSFFWFFILVAFCPYLILTERMGFADSLLVAFSSISLAIWFWAKNKLSNTNNIWHIIVASLISGFFLSLAYMTKTTARLFLVAQAIVSFCWTIEYLVQKKWIKAMIILLGVLLTLGVYKEMVGYLRVGAYRFWNMISTKEQLLTFSPNQIIHHPDTSLYKVHLPQVADYFKSYFGWVIILTVVGVTTNFIKHRQNIWLSIYLGVIFVGVFLSGKVTTSRYFYPISYPLIAISSLGAYWLYSSRQFFLKALVILICVITIKSGLNFIFFPLQGAYASDDQGYLLSSDISAFGAAESINYIKSQSEQNVVVGVSGIWGVAEGTVLVFQDAGIDSKVIQEQQISSLVSDPTPNKYLYMPTDKNITDVLQNQPTLSVVKTFPRPKSDISAVLIKLNDSSK